MMIKSNLAHAPNQLIARAGNVIGVVTCVTETHSVGGLWNVASMAVRETVLELVSVRLKHKLVGIINILGFLNLLSHWNIEFLMSGLECPKKCDVNAQCVEYFIAGRECVCNNGYEGNGTHCRGRRSLMSCINGVQAKIVRWKNLGIS